MRSSMRVFLAATVILCACVGDTTVSQGDSGLDSGTQDAPNADGTASDGPTTGPLDPPRPIAPLSTATVTTQTPTLHWALANGTDGAVIDICKDRACTTVVTTIQAKGTSGKPTSPLPAGVLFWRLRSRSGNVVGIKAGPTWQFVVGARSAPTDTSWGTTPDVNGDGYADVLIGSYIGSYNNGAHVFLGGAAGLGLAAAATLTITGAQLSPVVASAGDVNGDGFADVIVGYGGYVGTGADGGTEPYLGAAYVFLGGPAGIALTPATTLFGLDGASGLFGSSVASAGDVNGDGYADVIVGTGDANYSGGLGNAYVFLGGPSGLATTPAAVTHVTPPSNLYIPLIVASAGDVNGDGFGDVVVGAPTLNSNGGEVDVYLGSAQGLSTTAAMTVKGTNVGALLGSAVGAADVNGDGFADVLAGAPLTNSNVGAVALYLGGASGPSTTAIPIVAPDGGNFGWSVAGAGDVDGDGYCDVVVGARLANSNLGKAYVYTGSASGLTATPKPIAAPSGGQFGFSVAGAGDVDGDGYGDIVIAAPLLNANVGAVYVYLGSATNVKPTPATPNVPTSANEFGVSVALANGPRRRWRHG